jgi:cytochrome c oxidase subunit 4
MSPLERETEVTERDEGISKRAILGVGALLLLLALGTFLVAGVPLGAWSLPVALVFAVAKAVLIAIFFMELLHHGNGARLVLFVSIFFVVLLGSLVIGDAGMRFRLTVPPGPHPVEEGAGSPANKYEHITDTSGPRRFTR